MEWKQIADEIVPKKDLANNEEIKRKLESLSLYNSALMQLSDDGEDGSEERAAALEKEDEVRQNTLSKIIELQDQSKQAASEEEKISKLIECFLYADNYLSLYAEPELFFVKDETEENLAVYDTKSLLGSQSKFDSIVQCVFFFQELNHKAHSSLKSMCEMLNETNKNIMLIMGDTDYMAQQLDKLNEAVFSEEDESLQALFPFVLLSNYAMQRLHLHSFAANYPFNEKKSAFEKALKQKEPMLEKTKLAIFKYSEIVKNLEDKIFEPLYQEVQYDSRYITINDENIILKKDEPENGGHELINIIYDKTKQCSIASFWISFLIANTRKLNTGEKNLEANKWLGFYFEAAKESKYDVYMSLHKFLNDNGIYNAYSFNIISAKLLEESLTNSKASGKKPSKSEKANASAESAQPGKKMPLWLVLLISALLIGIFGALIFITTKPLSLLG